MTGISITIITIITIIISNAAHGHTDRQTNKPKEIHIVPSRLKTNANSETEITKG